MENMFKSLFHNNSDLILAFMLPVICLLSVSLRHLLKNNTNILKLFTFYLSIVAVMFVGFSVGMFVCWNPVIVAIGLGVSVGIVMLFSTFAIKSSLKTFSFHGVLVSIMAGGAVYLYADNLVCRNYKCAVQYFCLMVAVIIISFCIALTFKLFKQEAKNSYDAVKKL
jgi:hypothetical protein